MEPISKGCKLFLKKNKGKSSFLVPLIHCLGSQVTSVLGLKTRVDLSFLCFLNYRWWSSGWPLMLLYTWLIKCWVYACHLISLFLLWFALGAAKWYGNKPRCCTLHSILRSGWSRISQRVGANPEGALTYYLANFFPKTVSKWKKLDCEGGAVTSLRSATPTYNSD